MKYHDRLSLNGDPFLLNTHQTFSFNPKEDYEHLVNHVERHTKCSIDSCLRKKGFFLMCDYDAPWEVHVDLALYRDEKGKKSMSRHKMMNS